MINAANPNSDKSMCPTLKETSIALEYYTPLLLEYEPGMCGSLTSICMQESSGVLCHKTLRRVSQNDITRGSVIASEGAFAGKMDELCRELGERGKT